MKWFEGSISDAVITSKRENAVFVVFIEGKDEASKIMLSAVSKPTLSHHLESNSFVSVKVESGTESHTQFTEIYKLVPVPSVFFIGQNGAPLEIVAGENSEEIVMTKLEAAIKKCIGPVKQSSENCTQETSSPSSSHKNFPDGSEQDVNLNIPMQNDSPPEESGSVITDEARASAGNDPVSAAHGSPQPSPSSSNTEKLSKDQLVEIIEKKKEARKAEEEREEKEREIKRRKVGQSMMEAKRKQQEMEMQNLRMELRKEKELEKEAKQRVLDQIAQDRAERVAKISTPAAPSVAEPPIRPAPPPSSDSNSARIQFKLPDGQTKTHSFPAETTLGQVRQFIDNNIVLPFREYHLATTFPRREFTHRDIQTDLRELQLLPTAVVLIMPLQGSLTVSSGTNWPKTLMDMLWDLIQPLFTFSKYLQSLVFGRGRDQGSEGGQHPQPRTSPAQSSASNPSANRTGPPPSRIVRRRGNIHSLADNDNSNDENNTWNGNSTQQM